jgi:hypothetical protein
MGMIQQQAHQFLAGVTGGTDDGGFGSVFLHVTVGIGVLRGWSNAVVKKCNLSSLQPPMFVCFYRLKQRTPPAEARGV